MSSLSQLFLSRQNIIIISSVIGRNASDEMNKWSSERNLDDYESVQMDFTEALDFANNEFSKAHKPREYELSLADGKTKHPKYFISNAVTGFNVNDWRTFDAQSSQEIFRSNKNFRHGNRIKPWQASMHKRHYDRDEHENGLKDIRELQTIQRGYNMEAIYGKNQYVSSDSLMYDY
jgi:hypothetical protein